MCESAQKASGQKRIMQTGVYRLPDRHSKYLARHGNAFRAFFGCAFVCAIAQNDFEQRGMMGTGVDGCLYRPFCEHPKPGPAAAIALRAFFSAGRSLLAQKKGCLRNPLSRPCPWSYISIPGMPPMPPMLRAPWPVPSFSSTSSATIASVVSSSPATEAAFCSAVRATLVGSTTPISTRSP